MSESEPHEIETYYADYGGTPGILKMTVDLGQKLQPILKESGWEAALRDFYGKEGHRVCEFLFAHMPGGLIDAVFAEMARRKASVFSVGYNN